MDCKTVELSKCTRRLVTASLTVSGRSIWSMFSSCQIGCAILVCKCSMTVYAGKRFRQSQRPIMQVVRTCVNMALFTCSGRCVSHSHSCCISIGRMNGIVVAIITFYVICRRFCIREEPEPWHRCLIDRWFHKRCSCTIMAHACIYWSSCLIDTVVMTGRTICLCRNISSCNDTLSGDLCSSILEAP